MLLSLNLHKYNLAKIKTAVIVQIFTHLNDSCFTLVKLPVEQGKWPCNINAKDVKQVEGNT